MYTVIELQTTNGVTSILTFLYADRDQAEAKFHNILAYAAVSTVEIHAVSIIDALGDVVKNDRYYHSQPEPEPNPEEVTEE